MVQHALDRGYEVVGVCRKESVPKLDGFKGRITVIPGATDDREVIERGGAMPDLRGLPSAGAAGQPAPDGGDARGPIGRPVTLPEEKDRVRVVLYHASRSLFQGFLALAQAGTTALGRRGADGMAGLAVDVGYADQAHLSRESRRLPGLTPPAPRRQHRPVHLWP